jgi:type I restriction enzyme M protein
VEAADDSGEEIVPEGQLVCRLTNEHKTASEAEETLQAFIEQLHREYRIEFGDMERDFRVPCVEHDGARNKSRNRTVSLAVFEHGKPHTVENVIRVAMIKPSAKADEASLLQLDEILSNLSDERDPVFGVWTNGEEMAFRMRTYEARSGNAKCTELTDFPAPDETLDDLEEADRRPLRIGTRESLLRAFKRCHDYLYGNQNMRGDRAFWQLLYLIFCKIHDERQSRRKFFVGATESSTPEGQEKIATRIKDLFEEVKTDSPYSDVFSGNEQIELNDLPLAYIASELGRYNLLGTDTDAKGMAYEAITSTTLKRERGQFFTPRNVIRMMVEMLDPKAEESVLDPACGSGGFLVVVMAHVRKHFLREQGADPDLPVPRELKKVEKPMRQYAKSCLYGIDVDPDLRKAARMNMVMNDDGHGNIFCFNSLAFDVAGLGTDEMTDFKRKKVGFEKFDYVLTNPPFGSKIPVTDQRVLAQFDLGRVWTKSQDGWLDSGRVEKKLSPELLFIELCYKYLKPGTGKMAIVLPNGILGNPGEKMEFVRWWMLRHLELLASVDLPAETFLPQVSVQASCVFLRRRHPDEFKLRGTEGLKQRPVFMAIAENCGHGRRGETRYVRGDDGIEVMPMTLIRERIEDKTGSVVAKEFRRPERVLADDFPWIAAQYRKHAAGQPFEGS